MADIVPYQPGPVVPPGYQPRFSNPEGYPEVRESELGISHYLGVLRRQIWIVLGAVAVCLGAAVWVVASAPPRYTADAVVRLADARRAMTGGQEGGAYEQVLGRETDVLLSQIQVMMSRQVASDVVHREGLRFVPFTKEPQLDEIARVIVDSAAAQDTIRLNFDAAGYSLTEAGQIARSNYGLPASIGGVTVTVSHRPKVATALYQVVSTGRAIDAMRSSFKAAPRPKTDVIDVQFTSTSPRYAQRVVNAIVQAFQEHNALGAQKASRTRRIFLEEQLKQTDAMLQRAMAQYSSYRSGNQVFSSKEKASAQQAGIVDVDMRRADLNAQRRTYNALLSQAQKSGESSDAGLKALVSSPGIAANPVIQQLYAQLTSFEGKRDSLISDGAALTNPDVIRASTLVSQTSGRLMAAVRNQIQSLDAQIDALDDLKKRSTAEIASAPQAETEEARLGEQVAAVQRMSDKLQEEYQGARMAEAVEAGQVEIIDLADIPTSPISAGRTKKLALGFILGLIIGIGTAIIVDGMNTSIRRRDDIEKILQVPGLAVIPKFAERNGQSRARLLPKKAAGRNGKSPARAAGLVTVHDARSSGAEAYRTLRTNLIFSQAVQTLRSIVVTSAAPGEGKTTTAANLAVSFAQQGMRVLIIDCDLRRSRLHKMFSIPREPGITECVLGQLDTDAAPRETSVTGLYVVPSGQLPPNPSELLGGERMRKTLASFAEAFDLIVLDTPPLLAASDAAILSTLADGVVLVVRAGVTEAEAGQQAMQQLMSVGARVVGAVLNDPDAKVQKYGGYYSYDYANES